MKKLYSNIGKKLMTFAVVIAVIVAVIGIFAGLVMMTQSIVGGLIFIILYPIIGYVSSLTLYAFGKLVQSAENIEQHLLNKSNENNAE